jgi:CRP-like cAMP-binding protein
VPCDSFTDSPDSCVKGVDVCLKGCRHLEAREAREDVIRDDSTPDHKYSKAEVRLAKGNGNGHIEDDDVDPSLPDLTDATPEPNGLHGAVSKANGIIKATTNGTTNGNGFAASEQDDNSDNSDIETTAQPAQVRVARRRGVLTENWCKGYYQEPFWNKHPDWEQLLFETLWKSPVFSRFTSTEIKKFVRAMEIHKRDSASTDPFAIQGEPSDGLFIVLVGDVECYADDTPACVASLSPKSVVDEAAVLWSVPRKFSLKAVGACTLAKLRREDYVNLHVRLEVQRRDYLHSLLKGASLLEMMDEESIAKLVDVLKVRRYNTGEKIIQQGAAGHEFFVLTAGEAVVTIKTAEDEQECMRYKEGDLFGEVALLENGVRRASVTALSSPTEVLVLSRTRFERLLGRMDKLQQQAYQTDPRKLIADFYSQSDGRGPLGTLKLNGLEPSDEYGKSFWFAVYRPTSKDAIAKMLGGIAVGKGLNIKGKSSKQGILSGFVPFIQISDNQHKELIEVSPADARLVIYYKTKHCREEARSRLQEFLSEDKTLKISNPKVNVEDSYEPTVYGLDVPEPLLHEAYINRPDLSPVLGWETGRRSEPAFMDYNLHAVRETTEPKVVLYQFDESDAMNPRGLLVAYAEQFVKPVVSDFDTFTVGSKGIGYEHISEAQAELISWELDQTNGILSTLDCNPWMTRWLAIIKQTDYHPKVPKYGFGDNTSLKYIEDVITVTTPCGAVRHGAECCNFYMPQELDDEYLCIWHGFPQKPWSYLKEPELRKFLLERVGEGFSFPLNPVWPVRDEGWYEVLDALRKSEVSKACLDAWYPRECLAVIDESHERYPQGFKIVQ